MSSTSLTVGNMVAAVVQWAILLVLLRALVYKPLLAAMQKRRDNIAKNIHDSESLKMEAERFRQEGLNLIAKAKDEAKQIVANARREADESAKQIVAQAQREANYRQRAAIEEIEHERDVALAQIRGQVADMVVAATQKLLERNITAQDQHHYIDQFLLDVGQKQ